MPDKKTTSTRSAAAKKDAAKKTTAASKTTKPVPQSAKKTDPDSIKYGTETDVYLPEDCNYVVQPTDEQWSKMLDRCSGSNEKLCDLNESVKQLADAVGIIAGKLVPPVDPRFEKRKILSSTLALSDVRTMKNTGSSYRDTDQPKNDC